MKRNAIRPYVPHVLIWAIFFFLPFIDHVYGLKTMAEVDVHFVKIHFLNIAFLAAVFYLNRYVIAPTYFFRKDRVVFTLTLFGLLSSYLVIISLLIKVGPLASTKSADELNGLILRSLIAPAFIYILCVLSSTTLFLYDEQAQQKEYNRLIELEKTAAELTLLKLQISPHFLFNTLNNIRWLIRKKSEEAEESVLKLSEILRYITYEVADTKVALTKELEHLQNFIALQTLRLPVAGKIVFSTDAAIDSYLIEPLLFIHFVENAFKYGIDSKNAPDIQFTFKKIHQGIEFVSINKVLVKQTNPTTTKGIGLANIRRRLDLLYPHKHTLTIHQSQEWFEVKLILTLA